MKILLVQSIGYLYPWGGAHKANRILLEGLAERGHQCRVITPPMYIPDYNEYIADKKATGELELLEEDEELFVIQKNGVISYTVKKAFRVFAFIKRMIEEFQPDLTIVSEDNTHLLFETVLETKTRTVFFAHSQATLPFGPEAFRKDPRKIELYKKTAGIISVSEYVRSYFIDHAEIDSKLIYFPSYGPGPFPYLADFHNPYITVINPSAIKGFSIFIGLARRMPHLSFAAIPTWATSEAELEEMRGLPNITILPPAENINDIFKQTKVFLMPSLWGESFGQVVVEAMLRGIPAISSRVGGLPEAKLHLDYILPVNPIEKYDKDEFYANAVPSPIVPEQDIEPWLEALTKLTTDQEHYDELAQASYHRSADFHASLGIEAFEIYFQQLLNAANEEQVHSSPADTLPAAAGNDNKQILLERINTLSQEKRERLLAALQERR
ncbi:glycosyltransferase family 4 protein [Paenibacillus sp. NPDC058071]|uniref:glycosyltransferase family 4 protein n=1 Tax=Paenibacillus sp. NPDC058071 TaxID=3346326 RepID=UPI0036DD9DDE